jgi:lipopolysaccharide assembly protein A
MATDHPPVEHVESSGAGSPGTPASAHAAPTPSDRKRQQVRAKPPRTRTSRAFTGLVAAAIVLILLLIFILENTQGVKISFLGANGHLALGVALLLAAVGGALVTGILGAARIAQVRHHTKRYSRSARR